MLVIITFFIVLTFYAILSLMGVVSKFSKKDRALVVFAIALILIASYVLQVSELSIGIGL